MKKILFILLLLSSKLNAQTFTFECICDYVTGVNCDICNTNIQSRLFKGILIKKDSIPFKWIDQPYLVQFQGRNATFKELIPNGESITITLNGTPFDSIPQYQDSIKCPCSGSESFFIAGPGIVFSGDTISAVDTSFLNEIQRVDTFQIVGGSLIISLLNDGAPYSSVTLPVPDGSETKINAGTGISVTGLGTIASPYVIANTLPHAATNLTYSGTSSPLTLNSSTGTDVTHTAGTGISLSGSTSNMTITNSLPDVTVSIVGAGINNATGTYPNFTITGTEVDGLITNEGILGVGSGSGTSSTLITNTSTGNAVTINAVGILSIAESTSSNGGSITLTATEVDGSTTNELQNLSLTGQSLGISSGSGVTLPVINITAGTGIGVSPSSGNFTITNTGDLSSTNEAQTLSVSGTTSGIISLNAISGTGGGIATIAAGTGIGVSQSGGTITISNTGTAGWLIDGNTLAATRRIGSNDNHDVVVETNGTDRMWFDNAGAVSIGATQLTTAALNINGLKNSGGLLIAGGSGLVGPDFITITGSGSGSNADVFNASLSMLSGNVEATIANTAGSGTGGALFTLSTNAAATGDPKFLFTTGGTTNWTFGIDNSIAGEPVKLTANTDLGAATPAISATTANKVGVNQAAAVVTLQVSGTDAVGLPSGTIAQRSSAAIPQIRHNNTFSGFEFYDPNKNYWYRLTCVSSPTATANAAAGTGASAGLVSGAGSNDVRGAIELNTGSASLAAGTVVTVTYSNAFSGTATNVILTPKNDPATTESNKWRVTNETQNGFAIRAVTALTANTTYQFNYSIGQ